MHARSSSSPRLFWWAVSVVLVAACGDDPGHAELGERCAPDASEACVPGLVCSELEPDAYVCAIPLGDACNLEADEAYCVAGGTCTLVTSSEGDETHECRVPEGGLCEPEAPYCAPGLVCDPRDDDLLGCYHPVRLVGRVADSTDDDGIAGARVIGLDNLSVAVTDVAVSGEEGAYSLDLPARRVAADPEGRPASDVFTLRAQAAGYQTFPGGLRTALPINASEAVLEEDAWVISGALTLITLIPLPEPVGARFAISGEVIAEAGVAGVLVVAESDQGAFSAVSDRSGQYVMFNVEPGDYEVAGYAAHLQLEPVSVSVVDEDLRNVDLLVSSAPLSTVSGTIQIVNAPGDSQTSVILVVAATFDETFARGESPRGLRAPGSGPPSISGAWRIEGVPDGTYVVLAAFEKDGLVRDPDLNIGGTDIVSLTLPDPDGPEVTLGASFKVTEALDVFEPGAEVPEAVTAAPDLVWRNDTSEDWYEVRVFDAFGNLVWEDLDIDSVPGQSPPISVTYGGPLEVGMYYQFRAQSWRQPSNQPAAPISATEDLRGVFFVPAE